MYKYKLSLRNLVAIGVKVQCFTYTYGDYVVPDLADADKSGSFPTLVPEVADEFPLHTSCYCYYFYCGRVELITYYYMQNKRIRNL